MSDSHTQVAQDTPETKTLAEQLLEETSTAIVDGVDLEPAAPATPKQSVQDDVVPSQDSVTPAKPAASREADEVVAPQRAQAPVQQDDAIEFPDDLLREAGMTAEQARQAFGTPETMERALQWQLQQMLAAAPRRQQATQQPPQPTQLPAGMQNRQPVPQPAQQPVPPQPQGDQGILPVKGWYQPFAPIARDRKDANGDPLFSDETVQFIEEMDRHNAAQFDRLSSAVAPMVVRSYQGYQQTEAERRMAEAQKTYQEVEQRFAALGEDWEDTFGKGDARALIAANPADPHVAARARLMETVDMLRASRANAGLAPLSEEALFHTAIRNDHFTKLSQLRDRQTAELRAGRRNLQTHKPTGRRTPEASRDDATVNRVEAMLNKRGASLGLGSESQTIQDGF